MPQYYRTQKGFEGKIYQVPVDRDDVKDLIVTVVVFSIVLSLILCLAAFVAGLYVGWGTWSI